MNDKRAADHQAYWSPDKGSYLNTLNPFSGFTGGGDKVPGWWMNLFPSGSEKLGYLAFKSGACALLAAGIFGAYRGQKHFRRIADMVEDDDNPAGKLTSQQSTTFDASLTPDYKAMAQQGERKKKKIKASDMPKAASGEDSRYVDFDALSWENALSMALPIGASILAASMAYKGIDQLAGERRNALLERSIKAKSNAIKALMQTRAMIPKGNVNAKDINKARGIVDDDDLYVKQASLDKNATETGDAIRAVGKATVTTAGLLSSALQQASALGAYKYFSASDENNIRYKALKKGLKEYAKGKTALSPITYMPDDASAYFAAIDTGEDKKKEHKQLSAVREQPALDSDALNKPIAITL